MKVFLGIDVGTSGVKAILLAADGELRGAGSARLDLSTPAPGWAEQDPEAWWAATQSAVRQALAGSSDSVEAIGLSGQMHSSVFLDENLEVIRPALLWCDGRTTEQCRRIDEIVGEEALRAWVSNPALEGFTLPKILWLKQKEPGAFSRLRKVVLAKDYVRYRLSGELATEPSDAAGTLMFDPVRRRWSDELLRALDLPISLLPDVRGSAEVIAKLSTSAAELIGIPAGTPIVGGGADNACGAIGVGVVAPGEAVVSWGTSGTVLAPTTSPMVDPKLRVHTFCHAVPDTWYQMGVMLSAGGSYAWYCRELCGDLREVEGRDEELARGAGTVPPGAEGLTFLPYLCGERTPHRDASARGALIGLTAAHTRDHITRAVLEGICFGLKDSLEILRELDLPIRRLLVTGGGTRSAFVRQMQADIFGFPLVRVEREEGPAIGAAILAAVGCGAYDKVHAATESMLKRKEAERPADGAATSYADPYRRYRDLYPALRPIFKAG